jgi:hypothetical protein
MKLKKGSLEAKRFMAKIRAMKSGTKKKSIGATKFVEKKETKSTKPKRTIQITRRGDGTFKKFKQINGLYDNIKSKVNRLKTTTKKNIAYSVIDSAIKSANENEKLALKKAKATIKNTYLGATKFVEKNETSRTKPKRNIQITRRADGTFKQFKSLSGQNVNFKKHIVYKKYLIDVVELTKGGYQYIVNSSLDDRDIPVYFADSLSQAKKFIDRALYLLKKIQNKK